MDYHTEGKVEKTRKEVIRLQGAKTPSIAGTKDSLHPSEGKQNPESRERWYLQTEQRAITAVCDGLAKDWCHTVAHD